MDDEIPQAGNATRSNIRDAELVEGRLRLARFESLYAMRRPECFKPWEAVRPQGHILSQAIFALVHPGLHKKVSEFLADMDVGLFPEGRPAMLEFLWQHLLRRLQQGELVIRARRLPGAAVETLEADMFDDAVPDFKVNRLTCLGGAAFGSVRVFDEAIPIISSNTPPAAGATSTGRKGGRPRTHDWPGLLANLAVKLSEDGCPGPGEQAELEQWAAAWFPPDRQPAESQIREYVAKAIAAHRHLMG